MAEYEKSVALQMIERHGSRATRAAIRLGVTTTVRAGMALTALLGATAAPSLCAQEIASLRLTPVRVSIAVGGRETVIATARDESGNRVTVSGMRWTTSDPDVANVQPDPTYSQAFVVLGIGPGAARIEARIGNQRAVVEVEVTPAAVVVPPLEDATILRIRPRNVLLLPEEEIQLRPQFFLEDGSQGAASPLSWRSLQDIATVSEDGVVLGVSPGEGVIEARTATGLFARVFVEVTRARFAFGMDTLTLSPDQVDTIQVTVPDDDNRSVSSVGLDWISTDVAVARVTPLGVVTAVAPGVAEIVVSGYGQDRRLPVRVHRLVDVLVVTPSQAGVINVPPGGAMEFTAKAIAEDASDIPEAPLTWHVADTSIARFDATSNELYGVALGRTTLTVEVTGLRGEWDIEVATSGLALEDERLGLGRGNRTRLRAWFIDDAGAPITEARDLAWLSLDEGVVEVDSSGTVVARGFGTARVVALTRWDIADTAIVHVTGSVLVTSTRAGSPDIYSFDPDDPSQFHRMTDLPGSETHATYSPDGARIAYISDATGTTDLYVANADGTDPRNLTNSTAIEGTPAWTPDDQHLLYESDASGTTQIWIMNADGTQVRQLTQGKYVNAYPAVSPDGRTVAFASQRDGNFDIYLMNLDGSEERNITNSSPDETLVAWVGNNTLAFITQQTGRRQTTRVVSTMRLGEDPVAISPAGTPVSHFAISPEGDWLALAIDAAGPRGTVENRLYLAALSGDGSIQEVPRAGDHDRLLSPSFRR